MKSLCNNCDKAEKQLFEAKTVINYSSLGTGCDLCLQRVSYKSAKNYLKMTKLKNPNLFLKTDNFKIHNILRITTNSNGSNISTKYQHHMTLSNGPTKNKFINKPKHQTVLQHDIG